MRRFEGSAVSDLVRRIELSGRIDPDQPRWTVSGTIEGLEFSPEFRDAVPAELAQELAVLGSLRGQVGLSLKAGYDPSRKAPYSFDIAGQLSRARLDDSRLPHPLNNLRAEFHCGDEGIRIERFSAQSGQATIHGAYRRSGHEEKSPCVIVANVRDLELDRELEEVLPEPLRKPWREYLPAGQVHIDSVFSFDGTAWTPEVTVECVNVSYSHDKFPYRLERSSGWIKLKGDVLTARLTGYSVNQPIRISAEVTHPHCEPDLFGWIEIKGDDLPLDEKLLSALPRAAQSTIRSLEPHGTINAWFRAWRDRPGDRIHRHLKTWPNQCSIRYTKFAYPVSNIGGRIELLDDRWEFREMEGSNGTAHLTCTGYLAPTPRGHELSLNLTGSNIPLDTDLRNALKPDIQRLWDDLKPQGVADLPEARVRWDEREHLEVSFRARPRSDSASILPVCFPYRLEKLRGEIAYEDGGVTLRQFKGEHGNVQFSADGACEFAPQGGWQFVLKNLKVDRLRMDRELIQALPGRLKRAFAELNPRGAMDLGGWVGFACEGGLRAPVTSTWDVRVNFQQAACDCGFLIENVCGALGLSGQFDGQRFGTRLELNVDSATYKQLQFTDVTGPVWVDDDRVVFGRSVASYRPADRPGQPAASERAPRQITARLFGGNIGADGWVDLSGPRYEVRADLSGADLARLAEQVAPNHRNLRGTIAAEVTLRGAGRSLDGLGGGGRVQLREADIYELPAMVSLLKLLSIREPNTKAFSTSDMTFRVNGKNIYFKELKFNGDAISLEGGGELSVPSEKLNLTLHTLVGRGDLDLPLLKKLVGGASSQFMQIHVGGTLRNPEITSEAFPGVSQALQQFQSDLVPDASRR